MEKTANFLNNQRYILGEGEKKKILSSFLTQKITKTALSYLSLINSVIYFILAIIGFGISYYFFIDGSYIFILFSFPWSVYLFYKSIKSCNKIEIKNIKQYFLIKNNYGLNFFLWIVLLFSLRINIIFLLMGFDGILQFLAWILLLGPFIFIGILDKIGYITSSKVIDIFHNYKIFKLNLIHAFLFPIVFTIIILLYTILYIGLYFTKNFIIIKKTYKRNILQSFDIINKGCYENEFYEITKK